MELKVNSPKFGEHTVLIDDEDYDKIKLYHWGIVKIHNCFYIRRKVWDNGKQITILLHRIILPDCGKEIIDHINHNGLDNRKCNLRVCNNSENCRNQIKPKHGVTSKYKGVCFCKKTNKYESKIQFNRITYYLGQFEKEKDAAITYNQAALKYHGKFARLNIIDEGAIENF